MSRVGTGSWLYEKPLNLLVGLRGALGPRLRVAFILGNQSYRADEYFAVQASTSQEAAAAHKWRQEQARKLIREFEDEQKQKQK